jgi:soluble lytic murein transglycosylase
MSRFKKRISFKQQKTWLFAGILFLILGSTGLVMEHFYQAGFSNGNDTLTFEDGNGISYSDAGRAYRQAEKALGDHDYETAVALYDKIKGPYKRLRPLILLHEAEAQAQQNNESDAQETLNTLVKEYANTPFEALALYPLGQSLVRVKRPEQAKMVFEQVIQKAPQSSLAIGSQYYLGELARAANDDKAVMPHWRAYLQAEPAGTFSVTVAKSIDAMPERKISEDDQFIGQVYYQDSQWKEALAHLVKVPLQDAWLPLGKAYLHDGNTKRALQTLEKGLSLSKTQKDAEDGIKAILSATPQGDPQKKTLQQLLQNHPKYGGDFMLWQLMKRSDGTERLAYAQQLINGYHQSNWAPETSWELMWNQYKAGQLVSFLALAENHLIRYPNSVSAPRVLFWKAKAVDAQGKKALAESLFKQLTETYPNEYYAFRAQQILVGVSSPWQTVSESTYPAKLSQEIAFDAFEQHVPEKALVPVFSELVRIHAPTDILMMLSVLAPNEHPSPLVSLAKFQEQDYAGSIRVVRDYLAERRKAGDTKIDANLLMLLYPLLFTEQIAHFSSQYHLDPFLVQALMRQESYFNPLALSSSKAMGLMQLMPATAQAVAHWEHLDSFQTATLFDPMVNIQLGTRYLRYLHDKFGGNSMLAVGSYNGGPGAMSRWVNASPVFHRDPDMFIESIPYSQTRDYIKEVFSHYWNYQQLYKKM